MRSEMAGYSAADCQAALQQDRCIYTDSGEIPRCGGSCEAVSQNRSTALLAISDSEPTRGLMAMAPYQQRKVERAGRPHGIHLHLRISSIQRQWNESCCRGRDCLVIAMAMGYKESSMPATDVIENVRCLLLD